MAGEVQAIAFGDLFLPDVRQYRIRLLEGTGLEPVFPLWNLPTPVLARTMIQAGLGAILTCVDPRKLDRSFAGREYDLSLLEDLPEGVDPCGERGEFHSFVHTGPMFQRRLEVALGTIVERDNFVFAELLPARGGSPQEGALRSEIRGG